MQRPRSADVHQGTKAKMHRPWKLIALYAHDLACLVAFAGLAPCTPGLERQGAHVDPPRLL